MKNENIAKNGHKNEKLAKNRDFVTYPTPFFAARIEGELEAHISARSYRFLLFFFNAATPARTYIFSPEPELFAQNGLFHLFF